MSTTGPVNKHQLLREHMTAQGYYASDYGVCAGFINMWSQAILVGEQKRFHERLLILTTTKPKQLMQQINEEKRLFAKLSKEQQQELLASTKGKLLKRALILEMQAFLEGVMAHQNFIEDPRFTGMPIYSQEFKTKSALVGSKRLDEMGGVSELCRFSGLFNLNDFQKLFDKINQRIQSSQSKTPPFVISISNLQHRVALGWDGQHFSYIDVAYNNIDQYHQLRIDSGTQFAHWIFHSFNHSVRIEDNKDISKIHSAVVGHMYSTTENAKSLQTIANGELGYLKDVPQHDPNQLNTQDQFGVTWLHAAVRSHDPSTVHALISAGADPRICDVTGFNPIMTAAALGNEAVFLALMPAIKLNPNSLEQLRDSGSSPIHDAVLYSNIVILNHIVNTNLNTLNLKNVQGNTPLNLAVHKNKIGCVTFLLAKGADLDVENSEGTSPDDFVKNRPQINPYLQHLFIIYRFRNDLKALLPHLEADIKDKKSLLTPRQEEDMHSYVKQCQQITSCTDPDKLSESIDLFHENQQWPEEFSEHIHKKLGSLFSESENKPPRQSNKNR